MTEAPNIFVYDAADRESQLLVGLVRFCDQAEHRFAFLPVTGAASAERMHRFLAQHGLRPDAVPLPFVVAVGGGRDGGRTVLHGDPIHQWLGSLVRALTAAIEPAVVYEHIVAPCLAPYTLRLLAHALLGAEDAHHRPPQAPPPPPPPVTETGPNQRTTTTTGPPQPPPLRPPAPESDAESDDGAAFTEVSTTAVNATAAVPMRRKERVINISEVMAQSKERESMGHASNRRPLH